MKIVVDTNVFVSGVFWTGAPATVLSICSQGHATLVLSPAIIDEYRRVGRELSKDFRSINLDPIIDSLVLRAQVVLDCRLPAPVCSDADDDKFLAAALAGNAAFVVSGDKALLRVREYQGVLVVTPRQFVRSHAVP